MVKLKGSTIIEPIVALMLISFALTASFTVVIRSNNHSNTPQHVRAQIMASTILNESIRNEEYITNNWEDDGLYIERIAEPHPEYKNLIHITISIHDNKNNVLIHRHKLITHVE